MQSRRSGEMTPGSSPSERKTIVKPIIVFLGDINPSAALTSVVNAFSGGESPALNGATRKTPEDSRQSLFSQVYSSLDDSSENSCDSVDSVVIERLNRERAKLDSKISLMERRKQKKDARRNNATLLERTEANDHDRGGHDLRNVSSEPRCGELNVRLRDQRWKRLKDDPPYRPKRKAIKQLQRNGEQRCNVRSPTYTGSQGRIDKWLRSSDKTPNAVNRTSSVGDVNSAERNSLTCAVNHEAFITPVSTVKRGRGRPRKQTVSSVIEKVVQKSVQPVELNTSLSDSIENNNPTNQEGGLLINNTENAHSESFNVKANISKDKDINTLSQLEEPESFRKVVPQAEQPASDAANCIDCETERCHLVQEMLEGCSAVVEEVLSEDMFETDGCFPQSQPHDIIESYLSGAGKNSEVTNLSPKDRFNDQGDINSVQRENSDVDDECLASNLDERIDKTGEKNVNGDSSSHEENAGELGHVQIDLFKESLKARFIRLSKIGQQFSSSAGPELSQIQEEADRFAAGGSTNSSDARNSPVADDAVTAAHETEEDVRSPSPSVVNNSGSLLNEMAPSEDIVDNTTEVSEPTICTVDENNKGNGSTKVRPDSSAEKTARSRVIFSKTLKQTQLTDFRTLHSVDRSVSDGEKDKESNDSNSAAVPLVTPSKRAENHCTRQTTMETPAQGVFLTPQKVGVGKPSKDVSSNIIPASPDSEVILATPEKQASVSYDLRKKSRVTSALCDPDISVQEVNSTAAPENEKSPCVNNAEHVELNDEDSSENETTVQKIMSLKKNTKNVCLDDSFEEDESSSDDSDDVELPPSLSVKKNTLATTPTENSSGSDEENTVQDAEQTRDEQTMLVPSQNKKGLSEILDISDHSDLSDNEVPNETASKSGTLPSSDGSVDAREIAGSLLGKVVTAAKVANPVIRTSVTEVSSKESESSSEESSADEASTQEGGNVLTKNVNKMLMESNPMVIEKTKVANLHCKEGENRSAVNSSEEFSDSDNSENQETFTTTANDHIEDDRSDSSSSFSASKSIEKTVKQIKPLLNIPNWNETDSVSSGSEDENTLTTRPTTKKLGEDRGSDSSSNNSSAASSEVIEGEKNNEGKHLQKTSEKSLKRKKSSASSSSSSSSSDEEKTENIRRKGAVLLTTPQGVYENNEEDNRASPRFESESDDSCSEEEDHDVNNRPLRTEPSMFDDSSRGSTCSLPSRVECVGILEEKPVDLPAMIEIEKISLHSSDISDDELLVKEEDEKQYLDSQDLSSSALCFSQSQPVEGLTQQALVKRERRDSEKVGSTKPVEVVDSDSGINDGSSCTSTKEFCQQSRSNTRWVDDNELVGIVDKDKRVVSFLNSLVQKRKPKKHRGLVGLTYEAFKEAEMCAAVRRKKTKSKVSQDVVEPVQQLGEVPVSNEIEPKLHDLKEVRRKGKRKKMHREAQEEGTKVPETGGKQNKGSELSSNVAIGPELHEVERIRKKKRKKKLRPGAQEDNPEVRETDSKQKEKTNELYGSVEMHEVEVVRKKKKMKKMSRKALEENNEAPETDGKQKKGNVEVEPALHELERVRKKKIAKTLSREVLEKDTGDNSAISKKNTKKTHKHEICNPKTAHKVKRKRVNHEEELVAKIKKKKKIVEVDDTLEMETAQVPTKKKRKRSKLTAADSIQNDVDVPKLPDHFLKDLSQVKVHSKVGQAPEATTGKKKKKEKLKVTADESDDFIPLEAGAVTKFGAVLVERVDARASKMTNANFKHDKLFGGSVKRVPSSSSKIRALKQKAMKISRK